MSNKMETSWIKKTYETEYLALAVRDVNFSVFLTSSYRWKFMRTFQINKYAN